MPVPSGKEGQTSTAAIDVLFANLASHFDGWREAERRCHVSAQGGRLTAQPAGRRMLVTGGHAPACETLVTTNPWRS
jgi:hypothetical protein